jgi:hypothetical protein
MVYNTIMLDGVPAGFGIAIGVVFFGVVMLALFLLIYFFIKNKNKNKGY